MSTDTAPEKERRSIIQTLVDPKALPILIPILLAMGSAFMVHDRAINRMQAQSEAHLASAVVLFEKVDDVENELIGLKQTVTIIKDIQDEATGAQSVYSRAVQIAERLDKEVPKLKERVRELERYNDRHGRTE